MTHKKILVCGAAGFIGSHLVKRLKAQGHWVRGADLTHPEFGKSSADDFVIADLSRQNECARIFDQMFDAVYQLAADMGGAGYIFYGDNDAHLMHNSVTINLNVLEAAQKCGTQQIFFSSSACVYPEGNQLDENNPITSESSVYPANPDSEYGWEKLFSERLYMAYNRNNGMKNHVARYHNIFGPEGTWRGGREKVPAALCRKIAEAENGGSIEIWGDGEQTRSFLYIDACVEGSLRLMDSEFEGPVNIGSEEMVSINQLAGLIMDIAGKKLSINHIPGPLGVRGRNSDNRLIREKLGWEPNYQLAEGLEKTYRWIFDQVNTR
jgi:GDP-D-mannose 3',5'-epimerase